MGCNNAEPTKCAACYRGAPKGAPLDKAREAWYNGKTTVSKAKNVRNAKAHKAYHIARMTDA